MLPKLAVNTQPQANVGCMGISLGICCYEAVAIRCLLKREDLTKSISAVFLSHFKCYINYRKLTCSSSAVKFTQ